MAYNPKLREILSRPPVKVTASSNVLDILALMQSENVTAVVVVEANQPIGVMTERDTLQLIASDRSLPALSVGEIMTSPVITASADMDFFDAYHLCATHKIRHLVVVDEQGLLQGVASESDFLRILGIDVLSDANTVGNEMLPNPLLASPETPIQQIFAQMKGETGGAAIAVVDNKPVGILSERDAIRLAQCNLTALSLGDVMTSPVLTIPDNSSIYTAIDLMRQQGVRRLVVVDENGLIAGLFTEHEVVKRIENRYIKFLSTIIERQIKDISIAREKLSKSAVLTSILRESLDIGLIATDIKGTVEFINPDAAQVLDIEVDQALGRSLADLHNQAGFNGEYLQQAFESVRHGGRFTIELMRQEGNSEKLFLGKLAPIWSEQSELLGFVKTIRDITERKQAQEALQKNALIFENAVDGIMITDAQHNIISVNPAFTRLTGFSEDEVKGCNPRILASGQQNADFYQRMWHRIDETGYWQGEIWNRRKDGEFFAEWLTISAIKDDNGEVQKFIGVFADITALKRSEEEYKYMAHHDPLTGLPNRLLSDSQLDYALRHAKRHQTKIALMMLDLDGFKPVNDTYGHRIGDELLQAVASRLTNQLRNEDFAARLGGDEFVVILEDIRDAADVVPIAEKLLQSLSQPYQIEDKQIIISASIGIVMAPDISDNHRKLLEFADSALYEAKTYGKQTFRFYRIPEPVISS